MPDGKRKQTRSLNLHPQSHLNFTPPEPISPFISTRSRHNKPPHVQRIGTGERLGSDPALSGPPATLERCDQSHPPGRWCGRSPGNLPSGKGCKRLVRLATDHLTDDLHGFAKLNQQPRSCPSTPGAKTPDGPCGVLPGPHDARRHTPQSLSQIRSELVSLPTARPVPVALA